MADGGSQRSGQIPTMLVVGNRKTWQRDGRNLPDVEGFHFVGYSEVDPDLLERLQPDVVVSALMGEDFDAIELAQALSTMSYCGRYRALVRDLPNPSAVRREVTAAAPNIDFDILLLNLSNLH